MEISSQHHRSSHAATPERPERPEMQLELIGNNLDRLADRIFSSARTLNELADRVYGPPPPSPIPDGVTKTTTNAVLNRVSSEIDRCLHAQENLEAAIERFSSLA